MARSTDPQPVPGPGLRALVTYGPELLKRDPIDVAVDLREQYGYVVRIPPVYPALDQAAFLVTHPDAVQYILQTAPNAFRGLEIPGRDGFAAAVEGSILGPPGEGGMDWWLRRLRQISPEFSERSVVPTVPQLSATTGNTMEAFIEPPYEATTASEPPDPAAPIDEGPGVRLQPLAARLAMRLLSASLFAPDLRPDESTVIRSVARLRGAFKEHTIAVVSGFIARHLPGPISMVRGSLRARRAPAWNDPDRDPLDALQAVARRAVYRRVQGPERFDDAIATWLTRPDPVSGETMSQRMVADEVTGMLLAGYATMSAALTWALFLLATHQGTQAKLASEARRSKTLDVSTDHRPTTSEAYGAFLDDLSVAHRVWQETLRLYPTLPVFGRMTNEPMTLAGAPVPADAPVLVSPYVTQRDPAFWSAPTRFDPDRFRADRSQGRPPFAYYPFSAGPNGCLGRYVATVEAVTALATLCRDYQFQLVDSRVANWVGLDSAINLQPDREIRVRFDRRAD